MVGGSEGRRVGGRGGEAVLRADEGGEAEDAVGGERAAVADELRGVVADGDPEPASAVAVLVRNGELRGEVGVGGKEAREADVHAEGIQLVAARWEEEQARLAAVQVEVRGGVRGANDVGDAPGEVRAAQRRREFDFRDGFRETVGVEVVDRMARDGGGQCASRIAQ